RRWRDTRACEEGVTVRPDLYRLEADGSSRGNPGPAAGAAVLFYPDGTVLAEVVRPLGVATCNVAEYTGLIIGLERALLEGIAELAIQMDSRLVVEQVHGTWRVRQPHLRPLMERSRELLSAFSKTHLV